MSGIRNRQLLLTVVILSGATTICCFLLFALMISRNRSGADTIKPVEPSPALLQVADELEQLSDRFNRNILECQVQLERLRENLEFDQVEPGRKSLKAERIAGLHESISTLLDMQSDLGKQIFRLRWTVANAAEEP